MVLAVAGKAFSKVFGSRNDRLIKHYSRRVEQINTREAEVAGLSDAELRARTQLFRDRLAGGENIGQLMPEVLATAREVMDRAVGIRNILNPTHGFDASRLPEGVRGIYEQVAADASGREAVAEAGCEELVPGWMQVEIPVALYQAVRELYPESRPPFRARPFDVQLVGGMVLGEGRIAEMKTGEGKTIVAPLACYVACIEGLRCHVVTVNDYLVQRDRDWVFPFYYHLGLTVGAIHPMHMQPPPAKQQAYGCDVVYGTNSEFGFDYLRDNMCLSVAEQVQKERGFCIIDEVDSILIDEARTPLIISGPAHAETPRYDLADQLAKHLIQRQREWNAADEKVLQVEMRIKGLEGDIRNAREKSAVPPMREEMKSLQEQLPGLEEARDQHTQYYEVERERKAAHLTHEGVAEAQKVAGVGSFYVGNNMDLPHLLENALRGHVIYQRDKEYVVQNGEVIIVDEFTGRLMVGRQWSDGLHQAVESKEGVKIKQETQTLATVTIQNFFKLYKRLAGMTGTAITEATEFHEIYRMDVVSVPTNVPVIRVDRDDLVFLSAKDKWTTILDEIKRVHDVGRPVLVGTTSVEHSEMLSQMLTRKHGIKHEVLNAKQHEREAHIVEHAGELGAVMIATNMAGRGTDIKMAPIDRAALVRHWQQRDLLPKQATAELGDEELIGLSYRHQAKSVLGMKPKEVEGLSDGEVRERLVREWVQTEAFIEAGKAGKMTVDQCVALLDEVPEMMLHRLELFTHMEQMGGLHIVGTERHESRRIDNQLRGRSGRQGDRGSSRFFISLEDDLMKMFAGKTTMAALSKLGMKEGDAIEHRWITRSVERAQRKVEERNYEIRKNLLEYDEVMEHQRHSFYGIRQDVLEGTNVEGLIFEYIGESVEDAAAEYLHEDYVATQVAEWCRQSLDVSVEAGKLRVDDQAGLEKQVRAEARSEVAQTVELSLGEYMPPELDQEAWDLRGLSQWAMSRFSVDLKQNQLRKMEPAEVERTLVEAAHEQINRKDLSGLAKFIVPNYAQHGLADWARNKFDIDLDADELAELNTEKVVEHVLDKARESYRHREVAYPVEFMVDMVFQAAQQDGAWAAEQMSGWANRRYGMGWTPDHISKVTRDEIHEQLLEASEKWVRGGALEEEVDRGLAEHRESGALAEWVRGRFQREVRVEELEGLDGEGRKALVVEKGRSFLRAELTQLERFVLLQILDTAWKDHLYVMDQLKDSVGLRGYAERDPRIEYKREGSNLFGRMQMTVRDRVTDLIFRARLTPQVQPQSVYHHQEARHDERQSTGVTAGGGVGEPVGAAAGTSEQREGLAAARQAGAGDEGGPVSRKQRRAAAATEHKKSGPGGGKSRKRKSR